MWAHCLNVLRCVTVAFLVMHSTTEPVEGSSAWYRKLRRSRVMQRSRPDCEKDRKKLNMTPSRQNAPDHVLANQVPTTTPNYLNCAFGPIDDCLSTGLSASSNSARVSEIIIRDMLRSSNFCATEIAARMRPSTMCISRPSERSASQSRTEGPQVSVICADSPFTKITFRGPCALSEIILRRSHSCSALRLHHDPIRNCRTTNRKVPHDYRLLYSPWRPVCRHGRGDSEKP